MKPAINSRAAPARLFRGALALLLSAVLAACGGGGATATPTPSPTAQPTAVGSPVGATASLEIGPQGGQLSSADGRFILSVPAGAFTQATLVSIQAISNHAHGGKGTAYRITPEGLNSLVPMTLSFTVDTQILQGTTLAALSIGTQDAEGRWHAKRLTTRDAASGTLSVSTAHFSDWAVIAGAQLFPGKAEVAVGSELELKLMLCKQRPDMGDADTSVVDACEEALLTPNELENWSVNSVVGGNTTIGTITPRPSPGPTQDSARALYEAPVDRPTPDTVAVSVTYNELTPGAQPMTLVSNITIVRTDQCGWMRSAPTLNFDISMEYQFQGAGPLGQLSLNQKGRMVGELKTVFQNDLQGVWQGLTTQGSVDLNDQHTVGDQTTRLFGSGAPVNGTGIDANQLSGATLVVDYTTCKYALTASISVMSASGAPDDEARPHSIGSFTRGGILISPYGGLNGLEFMPPRLEPDAAGTYSPGGLGVGLVADGYATDESGGKARIEWAINGSKP